MRLKKKINHIQEVLQEQVILIVSRINVYAFTRIPLNNDVYLFACLCNTTRVQQFFFKMRTEKRDNFFCFMVEHLKKNVI